MAALDPFRGLGQALARLRERAGFSTQTEAAKALKIDEGQLSRWESENPRPTLPDLARLLAGYGAEVSHLADALVEVRVGGPSDHDLVESLAAAMERFKQRP